MRKSFLVPIPQLPNQDSATKAIRPVLVTLSQTFWVIVSLTFNVHLIIYPTAVYNYSLKAVIAPLSPLIDLPVLLEVKRRKEQLARLRPHAGSVSTNCWRVLCSGHCLPLPSRNICSLCIAGRIAHAYEYRVTQ